MNWLTDLIRKQRLELDEVNRQKELLRLKHNQEVEDLYLKCESMGGHISSGGFMYDSCARCGKLGA